MGDADEARLIDWLEVLEQVVNGRPEGHACPFCGARPLEVELVRPSVRVTCKACGERFEGRLP